MDPVTDLDFQGPVLGLSGQRVHSAQSSQRVRGVQSHEVHQRLHLLTNHVQDRLETTNHNTGTRSRLTTKAKSLAAVLPCCAGGGPSLCVCRGGWDA